MIKPLLEVKKLRTSFYTPRGVVRAVDEVSFQIQPKKILALVGESGCGKSMTALSIMRLVSPGKIESGEILFTPAHYPTMDLLKLSEEEMRAIRGNAIAMIFQEPMTSLNPVFTVGDQIVEAVKLHQKLPKKKARARAIEMLAKVGIPSPSKRVDDYPHQLSGGMRQRVMIAMALSCNPDLLIADEPTTALDVTIQAQIMDLMRQLMDEMGMAILLITHDMGVVAEYADEVAVMYTGKIAERAHVTELFDHPKHPYTKGLLQSIPSLQKQRDVPLKTIPGMVPNLTQLPKGCSFQERCERVQEDCRLNHPRLLGTPEHPARCFFPYS